MATAALLKIDPKIAAGIRNYIAQILQNPNANDRLKASLILEAMGKYNVTVNTISDATGYKIETINQYLSQAISPIEKISFIYRDGKQYSIPLFDFEKVRFQLRNEKEKLNFRYQGNLNDATLTDNVAAQLVYLGLDDILNFGKIEHTVDEEGRIEVDFVNTKTGKVLQKTDDLDPTYNYAAYGNKKCFSYINGGANGNYTMVCVDFTESNLPVFYTQMGVIDRGRGNTGVFPQIFNFIKPFAPLVLMAVGAGGLAEVLGEAVVGTSVAADYPILSKGIGQIAINTATTGGNVALAVTQAARGAISAGVVDNTALDPMSVGYVASSAAQAAIMGGNVKTAVSKALLFSGAAQLDTNDQTIVDQIQNEDGSVSTYYADGSFTTASPLDIPQGAQQVTITAADLGIDASQAGNLADSADNFDPYTLAAIQEQALYPDSTGNVFTANGSFVTLNQDSFIAGVFMDSAGNVFSPSNQLLLTKDEVQTLINTNPSNPQQAISDRLLNMWESDQGQVVVSGTPPKERPADLPPAAKETKVPTITDQLKATDQISKLALSILGTTKQIFTGKYQPNYAMSQYGTPRVQAVGVPITQPDGTVITNNGNGTQTIRSPNGQVRTISTGFTGSTGSVLGGIGLSTNTLLIAGGILAAALLLRR